MPNDPKADADAFLAALLEPLGGSCGGFSTEGGPVHDREKNLDELRESGPLPMACLRTRLSLELRFAATTASSGAQDLGSVVCHEFREHLSDVVASVVEACENAKLDARGDDAH